MKNTANEEKKTEENSRKAKNSCCIDKEEMNSELMNEKNALEKQIRQLSKQFEQKVNTFRMFVENWKFFLQENELEIKSKNYQASMSEMKNLLSRQMKLGESCKTEMEVLAKKFEDKTKEQKGRLDNLKEENTELKLDNKCLRDEVQRLRNELENKTVEAYEAKEMNGIYSAKLTKLERKFKKLRDEDEESYMEMTF